MNYYAITRFDTTKTAPFAVVRMKEGIFQVYRNREWQETSQYDGILFGEFSEYEAISADEASSIINR